MKSISYLFLFVLFSITLSACSNTKPDLDTALIQTNKKSKQLITLSSTSAALTNNDIVKNTPIHGGGYAKLGKPYKIDDKWYYPERDENYEKIGQASWYGEQFHGRTTANGETYDMYHFTAAHPTMPLPSYARITNLDNGSSMIVRVNDRGPYAKDRIIDLSMQAATMLGYKDIGTANVKVEYVGEAPIDGQDDDFLMASFQIGTNKPSTMQAMVASNSVQTMSNNNNAIAATQSLITKAYNQGENTKEVKNKKTSKNNTIVKTSLVEENKSFISKNAIKSNQRHDLVAKAAALDFAVPNLPQFGPIITQKPDMLY